MCFQLYKNYRKRKASKDIEVIKKIRRSVNDRSIFYSAHMGYKYEIGKIYHQKLSEPENKKDGNGILFSDTYSGRRNTGSKFISEGFHSYDCVLRAFQSAVFYDIIAVFIIPKGSSYYYNKKHHEYISDTILFKKILGISEINERLQKEMNADNGFEFCPVPLIESPYEKI